jgi:hypothetical protein
MPAVAIITDTDASFPGSVSDQYQTDPHHARWKAGFA